MFQNTSRALRSVSWVSRVNQADERALAQELRWQSVVVNALEDIPGGREADFGGPKGGVHEVDDMKVLKREMEHVDWAEWWVDAMGFRRGSGQTSLGKKK
jgi:hypothetical protein